MEENIKNPYKLIENHKTQLRAYQKKYGLRGLEARVLRGADPAAMLALKETSAIIKERFGDNIYETLIPMTNTLHIGGVWEYAPLLKAAKDNTTKAWLLMAYACCEANGEDLTPAQYVADYERVKDVLRTANINEAIAALTAAAQESFTYKKYKGRRIAYSEGKNSFINMAIQGERSGVCKHEIYFVGAQELDFDAWAKEQGLNHREKPDADRGGVITIFYQRGIKDVAKKLYPGFAIIFEEEELALELALKYKSTTHEAELRDI